MLDYKLIESLAAVVREGGFEKAAKFLYLTQSAVSQRVKLLEEQTGQVLLARSSPPRATAAGQKMVKHYLQVKRLEDDLLNAFVPFGNKEFVSLSVGVNEDSLAFWFFDAVRPFLETERVVLDIKVDDQEQTHRLLRDGDVVGCVSSHDKAIQGCRIDYLGRMDYSLFATPDFAARWFPDGLNADGLRQAPALLFSRKDRLHIKLFQRAIGEFPDSIPAHYLPSSEKFPDFIAAGLAYGMLPDRQASILIESGKLVNLAPSCHVPAHLYWHRWNIKSRLLEAFSRTLETRAQSMLER